MATNFLRIWHYSLGEQSRQCRTTLSCWAKRSIVQEERVTSLQVECDQTCIIFRIENHFMDVSVISNCSQNSPIAVLAHNPAATPKILNASNIYDRHVDLVFSGHTHAGQYYVIAPFVYWVLPYLYGIYPLNAGTTQLLVSSGTLYQAAPMKMPFFSQIWVVTLQSA